MTWTVNKIKDFCIEYCGYCDVEFKASVAINARLTRTLGRCWYNRKGTQWYPGNIEISRQLLETATDESIKEVIKHECAHWVACAITHEKHGHDEVFKHYCAMIGTENDGMCYDNLVRTKKDDEVYKYTLYCQKCGKLVGGRHRSCAVVTNPSHYMSPCCNASLRVQQNW